MQLCELRAQVASPLDPSGSGEPRGELPLSPHPWRPASSVLDPAKRRPRWGGCASRCFARDAQAGVRMRVMEQHSPVRVVQRSKGRTATAAAAYRSATRIECERTGQVHDYTRKQGVELTALLLPDSAPEWAHDRAALWNAAEMREKHPRAQTAREVEVGLPAEFSAEQRRQAGLAIGTFIVDRYGVAADLAWHQPSRKGSELNHHIHILFATRRFENGEWAKTKDRTLDALVSGKGAEEIIALRQGVADVLNNIAVREKLNVYVEHLSFEKRDLDLEPTQHLGPDATEMERRGVKTDIGEKNRQIAARNEERKKLHRENKVVDFEIEKERLQQKRAQRTGQPSPATAPVEANRPQGFQIEDFAAFYRKACDRRLEVLEGLDLQYGQEEKDTQKELAQLHRSVNDPRLLVRFWHRIIGRTRQEKQRIQELSVALDNIYRKKQEALRTLEQERREELERFKKGGRDRGDQVAERERLNKNRMPDDRDRSDTGPSHRANEIPERDSPDRAPGPTNQQEISDAEERRRALERIRKTRRDQKRDRGRDGPER